eukprot:18853-Eustigmatos_ZCMA.PRE.1
MCIRTSPSTPPSTAPGCPSRSSAASCSTTSTRSLRKSSAEPPAGCRRLVMALPAPHSRQRQTCQ